MADLTSDMLGVQDEPSLEAVIVGGTTSYLGYETVSRVNKGVNVYKFLKATNTEITDILQNRAAEQLRIRPNTLFKVEQNVAETLLSGNFKKLTEYTFASRRAMVNGLIETAVLEATRPQVVTALTPSIDDVVSATARAAESTLTKKVMATERFLQSAAKLALKYPKTALIGGIVVAALGALSYTLYQQSKTGTGTGTTDVESSKPDEQERATKIQYINYGVSRGVSLSIVYKGKARDVSFVGENTAHKSKDGPLIMAQNPWRQFHLDSMDIPEDKLVEVSAEAIKESRTLIKFM